MASPNSDKLYHSGSKASGPLPICATIDYSGCLPDYQSHETCVYCDSTSLTYGSNSKKSHDEADAAKFQQSILTTVLTELLITYLKLKNKTSLVKHKGGKYINSVDALIRKNPMLKFLDWERE